MDVTGLERLLARMESGEVTVTTRDVAAPSPLAHAVLSARPYAFLDDAPAEERRTRAVQVRRFMGVEEAAQPGQLDPAAVARVRSQAWPIVRNVGLHDALVNAPASSIRNRAGMAYLLDAHHRSPRSRVP
jgi:ATP-dependent Lhr-like helicase